MIETSSNSTVCYSTVCVWYTRIHHTPNVVVIIVVVVYCCLLLLRVIETKVYSRSVDPRKLRVGIKYYVVHSCIHQNHILRLLVCTRTARVKNASGYVCFAAVYFAFFFRGGQANPIQTS